MKCKLTVNSSADQLIPNTEKHQPALHTSQQNPTAKCTSIFPTEKIGIGSFPPHIKVKQWKWWAK